jgi:hypothetical protein
MVNRQYRPAVYFAEIPMHHESIVITAVASFNKIITILVSISIIQTFTGETVSGPTQPTKLT